MRTDRWNKKRELNLYAFYDHTGLERHLEKMAANGWMLESVGTYALRYRRCEPKKLRFAVVYYPKTDSFCPDEPNHENLTFWDYCAGAGWQIVTQRDDTHIFYNEDLDAVPIETEAVVQVETMERAKKGYVLSNTITVACMLPTMLYLQVSQLRRDPVAFLADGYDLTMMLMIFVVMVTVFAIGTELKHATAREWLGTGNGSVAAALAGKVLPITAVMFLISLVMLVINFKIVGTPLNGSLAVILAGTLLFILSYQSISVLIVSLLANLRLSLSIGGGYSVLAFTFSGLTFPIMAMWEPMQWVSKIFPFTFYTDIFVDQMLRGTPWVYSLPDLCYMSLFIVLPLLCLPRLKRVCTEEKFWGRL